MAQVHMYLAVIEMTISRKVIRYWHAFQLGTSANRRYVFVDRSCIEVIVYKSAAADEVELRVKREVKL